MIIISLSAAVLLALVHLYGGKLKLLEIIPRRRWLSFAGGVSVAFVFIHLLPELASGQQLLDRHEAFPGFIESHIYFLSLIGLIIFYGIEKKVKVKSGRDNPADASDKVFWLHIALFGFYNLIIGYLLAENSEGELSSLIFFAFAMILHFMVTDYGIQQHHERIYNGKGRWVLAACVILGWSAGIALQFSKIIFSMMIAFLAGGIILNVLKEELPEDRESSFKAFFAGAALYALIMIFV
jgi:hypothetical protein